MKVEVKTEAAGRQVSQEITLNVLVQTSDFVYFIQSVYFLILRN